MAFPFEKFLDEIQEPLVTEWSHWKIFEKLDGHLATLYFYNNNWNVASTSNYSCKFVDSFVGIPDGSELISSKDRSRKKNYSFVNKFWEIWKALNYSLPKNRSL